MADDKKIIFSMVGVSKVFPPQKQVLKDISFSAEGGKCIGILGANGCGKSTFLSILAGVLERDGGSFLFNGEDITESLAKAEMTKDTMFKALDAINKKEQEEKEKMNGGKLKVAGNILNFAKRE